VKLLVVANTYLPLLNGTARCAATWSRELARKNHDVTVVTPRMDGAPTKETCGGVTVLRVERLLPRLPLVFPNPEHVGSLPLSDPWVSTRLKEIARQVKPDLVHVHGEIAASVEASGVVRDLPAVLTLHDYRFSCPSGNLWSAQEGVCHERPSMARCVPCLAGNSRLDRAAARYCAFRLHTSKLASRYTLTAVSETVANAQAQSGFCHDDSIIVVPPCAEHAQVDVAENRQEERDGGMVLFVGVLSEKKGVAVLANALPLIEKGAHVVVVGIRYPWNRWQCPDGVDCLENLDHESVIALMRRAAVVVVPSVWPEPFGLVAQEAMAMGTPVVASDIGGLAEQIVNREDGLLIPPGDPAALAEAVNELLQDSDLKRRLGENGQRTVRERYSPDTVIPRLEAVFESAISVS